MGPFDEEEDVLGPYIAMNKPFAPQSFGDPIQDENPIPQEAMASPKAAIGVTEEDQKPDVMAYIAEKNGIKKPESSGPNWMAGLAALGAGLQGRDAFAAGESYKKSQRESAENAEKLARLEREKDPNSQETVLARTLAQKMVPKMDFSQMTAAQINERLPILSKVYDIEQRKLDRLDQREFQKSLVDQKSQERRDERAEKDEEKKKAALTEVETRRQNIEDNLKLLEDQIKEKGTYEMFGSHNEDLDRRVDAIATDMAKLADPQSVARPAEVEQFKKGLIESGALGMRNDTAINILKNFKDEVSRRADNAYTIRGIENPGVAKRDVGGGSPQERARAELMRRKAAKMTAGR